MTCQICGLVAAGFFRYFGAIFFCFSSLLSNKPVFHQNAHRSLLLLGMALSSALLLELFVAQFSHVANYTVVEGKGEKTKLSKERNREGMGKEQRNWEGSN